MLHKLTSLSSLSSSVSSHALSSSPVVQDHKLSRQTDVVTVDEGVDDDDGDGETDAQRIMNMIEWKQIPISSWYQYTFEQLMDIFSTVSSLSTHLNRSSHLMFLQSLANLGIPCPVARLHPTVLQQNSSCNVVSANVSSTTTLETQSKQKTKEIHPEDRQHLVQSNLIYQHTPGIVACIGSTGMVRFTLCEQEESIQFIKTQRKWEHDLYKLTAFPPIGKYLPPRTLPAPMRRSHYSSSSSNARQYSLLSRQTLSSSFGSSMLPALRDSMKSAYPDGLYCAIHDWRGPASETCPTCTSHALYRALPSITESSSSSSLSSSSSVIINDTQTKRQRQVPPVPLFSSALSSLSSLSSSSSSTPTISGDQKKVHMKDPRLQPCFDDDVKTRDVELHMSSASFEVFIGYNSERMETCRSSFIWIEPCIETDTLFSSSSSSSSLSSSSSSLSSTSSTVPTIIQYHRRIILYGGNRNTQLGDCFYMIEERDMKTDPVKGFRFIELNKFVHHLFNPIAFCSDPTNGTIWIVNSSEMDKGRIVDHFPHLLSFRYDTLTKRFDLYKIYDDDATLSTPVHDDDEENVDCDEANDDEDDDQDENDYPRTDMPSFLTSLRPPVVKHRSTRLHPHKKKKPMKQRRTKKLHEIPGSVSSMFVDAFHRVYLAIPDKHIIRVYTPSSNTWTTIGSGVGGSVDSRYDDDGTTTTTTLIALRHPTLLFSDDPSRRLYIYEQESGLYRLYSITTEGLFTLCSFKLLDVPKPMVATIWSSHPHAHSHYSHGSHPNEIVYLADDRSIHTLTVWMEPIQIAAFLCVWLNLPVSLGHLITQYYWTSRHEWAAFTYKELDAMIHVQCSTAAFQLCATKLFGGSAFRNIATNTSQFSRRNMNAKRYKSLLEAHGYQQEMDKQEFEFKSFERDLYGSIPLWLREYNQEENDNHDEDDDDEDDGEDEDGKGRRGDTRLTDDDVFVKMEGKPQEQSNRDNDVEDEEKSEDNDDDDNDDDEERKWSTRMKNKMADARRAHESELLAATTSTATHDWRSEVARLQRLHSRHNDDDDDDA